MSELELHIRETEDDAYVAMLGAHRLITDDNHQPLEVQGLNDFIWVPRAQPCMVCRQPTTWLDLDFEGPLHPGRCSEQMWDEYHWAEMGARLPGLIAELLTKLGKTL